MRIHYISWIIPQHGLLPLCRYNPSSYILADSAAGPCRQKGIAGMMMKLSHRGPHHTGPRSAENPGELVIYLEGRDSKHFSTGTLFHLGGLPVDLKLTA